MLKRGVSRPAPDFVPTRIPTRPRGPRRPRKALAVETPATRTSAAEKENSPPNLDTPSSPKPEEIVAEWKLIPIDLSPPRFTRPPRNELTTWDIRVRRLTSPRTLSILQEPISPLPSTPGRNITLPSSRATQTESTTTTEKETQACAWETSSESEAEVLTRLGNLKITKTKPQITYRERLI